MRPFSRHVRLKCQTAARKAGRLRSCLVANGSIVCQKWPRKRLRGLAVPAFSAVRLRGSLWQWESFGYEDHSGYEDRMGPYEAREVHATT